MFGRSKADKLVRQHLRQRGLPNFWWKTALLAIAECENGDPTVPLHSGAGPIPARSLVTLLSLESFVEGGVDWETPDDLTEPGGCFYPPNNETVMPTTELGREVLQEWFFPSGDKEAFTARMQKYVKE